MSIRPGDGRHGIKAQREAAFNHFCNCIKIEQMLHQSLIVTHGINHLNHHRAHLGRANLREIDIRRVCGLIFRDR